MPKLLVLTGITGSRVGTRTVLSGRSNTVGSNAGCDLVIPEQATAARHAEIRHVLERWFIVPLDPNARVFVNGEPVTSQGRLLEEDLITFGNATFKVSFTEEIEKKARTTASTSSSKGVPQLGEYLIRHNAIGQSQLTQALQHQGELRQQGRRVQIGDILYEMGYISRLQLEQALQDQRNDFFERFRD
ncbi:MAG: FHA domain-containing protein [Chloroflexales bacterium]|nr:FHA domain-containing protein [Chloroflexales bacterium]